MCTMPKMHHICRQLFNISNCMYVCMTDWRAAPPCNPNENNTLALMGLAEWEKRQIYWLMGMENFIMLGLFLLSFASDLHQVHLAECYLCSTTVAEQTAGGMLITIQDSLCCLSCSLWSQWGSMKMQECACLDTTEGSSPIFLIYRLGSLVRTISQPLPHLQHCIVLYSAILPTQM